MDIVGFLEMGIFFIYLIVVGEVVYCMLVVVKLINVFILIVFVFFFGLESDFDFVVRFVFEGCCV